MKRNEIRNELVHAAIERKTVTYGYLMKKFGLTRGDPAGEGVVAVVGKIDREERQKGAPGFAAIVVRQDTGYPGGGFFCWEDIPSTLKRKKSEGLNPKLSEAEKKYVRELQEEIWNYYQENYSGERQERL